MPPPRSAWPGTAGSYTTGVLDGPLTAATGDGLTWTTTPASRLNLVLTAAVQDGAYAPNIRDGAGKVLPYQSAVWYVDSVKNVVVFRRGTPAALGLEPPLTLSYWYYTGAISGTSLAVVGGFNVGGAPGEVLETITGGQMRFRTLAADTAPGREGLEVTVAGSQVRLGSTLTGATLAGPGAAVFSGKNGPALEFRRVAGASGGPISVTEVGDTVAVGLGTANPFLINEGAGAAETRIGTGTTTGGVTIGGGELSQEVVIRGGAAGGAVRINTGLGSTATTVLGAGAGAGAVSIAEGTPVANILTGALAGTGLTVAGPSPEGAITVSSKKTVWYIREEHAAGTLPVGTAQFGTAGGAWNRRYLNAVTASGDSGGNVTLFPGTAGAVPDSYLMVLPGTYYVTGRAPTIRQAGTRLQKLALIDNSVPGAPVLLLAGDSTNNASPLTTWATVTGILTVTATIARLELQHWVNALAGSLYTLGTPASVNIAAPVVGGGTLAVAPPEIYSQLEFTLLD